MLADRYREVTLAELRWLPEESGTAQAENSFYWRTSPLGPRPAPLQPDIDLVQAGRADIFLFP